MAFLSKPQPVFGLEWNHGGPSEQYRGGRKDGDWKCNGPWPSWDHSLTLLQGQPSLARGRLLISRVHQGKSCTPATSRKYWRVRERPGKSIF